MRRLRIAIVVYALLLTLALASVAHAENDGRGFYGPTNDKAITNIFFAVIIFFPLFIFAMSMLQGALERRKERRKAAEKQLGGATRWRGGW